MKHRLLLLLLFVFTAVMTGWAQNSATPSYTVKGVLLDSLTQVFYAQRYVCDVTQESKSVRLYSKSNKFTEVEAVNKETGAEITDAERKEANFVDDSQLWGKCLSILNESFSEEERTRVQGCKFIIILRVDTNTGIIRDVEYRFPAVSMLATVPVSVYQEMEIKLKKEIVFNITEKGKRFNYIPFVWAHTVK